MSSASKPCADTIAKDSSIPLAGDFLGCKPSRVRSYPLLKLDRTAPTGLFQREMEQVRVNDLHSSPRELASLPKRGAGSCAAKSFSSATGPREGGVGEAALLGPVKK